MASVTGAAASVQLVSPEESRFAAETAITPSGDGRWDARLSAAWTIADASNGGYALSPVLRALRELAGHPDPISVTTHFLRPGLGDTAATVEAEPIRSGRRTGIARGRLVQDGSVRLEVTAAFAELVGAGDDEGSAPRIELPPPDVPPPEECVDRSELAQGVDLPILSRVEVRLRPDLAEPGAAGDAVMEGWIRFRDGAAPDTMSLPLFCDAFPPSLYPYVRDIGWVPTVELTVHPRRRPAPGWLRASLRCDDLSGGQMIESGALWDSTGALVARSRQLGLLLSQRS